MDNTTNKALADARKWRAVALGSLLFAAAATAYSIYRTHLTIERNAELRVAIDEANAAYKRASMVINALKQREQGAANLE